MGQSLSVTQFQKTSFYQFKKKKKADSRNYNYNFIIHGGSCYQEYEMYSKNDGLHIQTGTFLCLTIKSPSSRLNERSGGQLIRKADFYFSLERQDWLIEWSRGRSYRAWTNRGKPAGFRRRRSKNCPLPTGLYILSFGVQQSVLNLSPSFIFPTHPRPISCDLATSDLFPPE